VSGQLPAAKLDVAMAPLPTERGNPYITQLCEQLERLGVTLEPYSVGASFRADILHFQWPDHFVNRDRTWLATRGVTKVLITCVVARARRRAVVWTVHNLRAHDSRHPALERVFWPLFTRALSGYICLTDAGRALALERFPRLRKKRGVTIAHGTYTDVYPPCTRSVADARQAFGLPATSIPLLFFGNIRAYKNVPVLIEAFRGVEDPSARLLVAGYSPDISYLESLERQADQDPRIVIRGDGHVPDESVSELFKAAVGIVLPYVDVFNSGSLFLALSMRRPVLVPRTPVFEEIRGSVGAPWITFFEGELDSRDLTRFFAHSQAVIATEQAPDLSAHAWPDLGRSLRAFYEALLNRAR
jgi:glycosyltransferase involved in cell wall biosynthesis